MINMLPGILPLSFSRSEDYDSMPPESPPYSGDVNDELSVSFTIPVKLNPSDYKINSVLWAYHSDHFTASKRSVCSRGTAVRSGSPLLAKIFLFP